LFHVDTSDSTSFGTISVEIRTETTTRALTESEAASISPGETAQNAIAKLSGRPYTAAMSE